MVKYEEHAVEPFRELLDTTQTLTALLSCRGQSHRQRSVADLDVYGLEAGQSRGGLRAGRQDDEERGEESQMPLSNSLTTSSGAW